MQYAVGNVYVGGGSTSLIATRKRFATSWATTGPDDFTTRERNASPASTRNWHSSAFFPTRLPTAATRNTSTENATTRNDWPTTSRSAYLCVRLTRSMILSTMFYLVT